MKTVDFNGRSIIASCKYCGSPNVTMDRSPIWDDGDWSIPNITPYSNNIFEYERGANIVTPYTRAYCKSCEGDTTILFNTLKERDSSRDSLSFYVVEVMERVPIDDDGGYDCLYFSHKFDSMGSFERSMGTQLWDRNCDIKIRKVMREEENDL